MRSIAVLMPPEVETWAPSCTRWTLAQGGSATAVRYSCGHQSPLCAEPDGLPAHRQRPHGALQLAVRAPSRRGGQAPGPEHPPELRRPRSERTDTAGPALATRLT